MDNLSFAQELLETFIGGEDMSVKDLLRKLSSPVLKPYASKLRVRVSGVLTDKSADPEVDMIAMAPLIKGIFKPKKGNRLTRAMALRERILRILIDAGSGSIHNLIEAEGETPKFWEPRVQRLRSLGYIKSSAKRDGQYRIYSVTRHGRKWLADRP